MMKSYTNTGRKPMMCGGDTKRTKKSSGGKVRNKYAAGTTNMEQAAATPASPTSTAAGGMSQEERNSLVREQIRLENLQDDGAATAKQLERLQVIYDKLGVSATPGRANVDR
jgi:hypothetical protein